MKKIAKKIAVLIMLAAFAASSLCACSGTNDGGSGQNSSIQENTGGASSQNSIVQENAGGASGQNSGEPENTGGASASGSLRLLSNRYDESACNTENGYYYLTGEISELRDGEYGSHLMYMDFASGREIYLCSTAGCQHDSLDCPSVFSYDDFPTYSTILFIFRDQLYILSREYDDDGSMSQSVMDFGGGPSENQPAALYRANLDGTGREKIYTFDAALTLEDKVVGNDKGIYVITKKLSVEKSGGLSYTESSERKLMFFDLDSLSLTEVCSMDFGDGISWRILGCSQNDFVLCGTDFGRELSRDEIWDDNAYKELYLNSSEVYALLSQSGGKPEEIIRQPNRDENSVKILGGSLYLSTRENPNIDVLDLKTGERKTLCALPQNYLMDTLGETLCCRGWDLAGETVWYFVNTKTGEITHSPMVNLCNGWALEFRCETAEDVLFIYDYDATGYKDGSYEIHQYRHALISKDDLFSGNENYRTIEMAGPGK